MSNQPPNFLVDLFQTSNPSDASKSCSVTLTFAQSVDAKIAGAGGLQLILSGRESMIMTHWMRTMHDAILVGIGTALNDDPQLNTRHLPPRLELYSLPRPVVLDANLRFKPTSKLLTNFREGQGRRPWLFTAKPELDEGVWQDRKKILEDAGARVEVIGRNNGQLSIPELLKRLAELQVSSLMVEGGASVIASFLSSGRIDTMLVTVAPRVVGSAGIGYSVDPQKAARLKHVLTTTVGVDTVMAWKAAS